MPRLGVVLDAPAWESPAPLPLVLAALAHGLVARGVEFFFHPVVRRGSRGSRLVLLGSVGVVAAVLELAHSNVIVVEDLVGVDDVMEFILSDHCEALRKGLCPLRLLVRLIGRFARVMPHEEGIATDAAEREEVDALDGGVMLEAPPLHTAEARDDEQDQEEGKKKSEL